MKTLELFSILLLFILMALQSCVGKTEQTPTSGTDKTSRTTAALESELKLTESRLSSIRSENKDLKASNEMLSEKLKELQEATQQESGGLTSHGTSDIESGGLSNQTRIALMGAKAIAEFKAKQAAKKVESLASDLSKRDSDLKKALVDLEIVSQQRDGLTKDLESLKAETKKTQSQIDGAQKKLEAKIAERNDLVSKLEGELNEKEELVNTLKKAWSDATQLKSNAEEQLSQMKNSFNDCQNQMAQMRGVLEQSKSESTGITNELENLKQELSSGSVQNRQLQSDGNVLQQLKECKDRLVTAVDKKQLELPPLGDLEKSHSIIERLLESGGRGKP